MKQIANSVLATLIAAGIIANLSFFVSVTQRLARIEAKLEALENARGMAKNNP